MPFYEYQCRACGQLTEVLQKVSDPPLRKCPACGKSQLAKLISAPVFRLKGGGWYETDFKSDGENKRNLVGAEKDEKPAAAVPAAADKKVETAPKPETKTPAKAEPTASSKSASKAKAKLKPAKPVRAAAKKARR